MKARCFYCGYDFALYERQPSGLAVYKIFWQKRQERSFCGIFRSVLRCAVLFGGLWFSFFGLTAQAQEFSPASARVKIKDKASAQTALEKVRHDLSASEERSKALQSAAQALKKDKAQLTAAVAAAVNAEQQAKTASLAAESSLRDLQEQHRGQLLQLEHKRAEMAEILAGAEKLGLNPPPVMLIHAESAAKSLYAASMLEGLLPQMQEKVRLMQADTQALLAVEAEQQNERRHLQTAQKTWALEQQRLSLLLRENAAEQQRKNQTLQMEEEKRRQLEQKAQSLQDLLAEILNRQNMKDLGAGSADGMLQITRSFLSLQGKLSPPVQGRTTVSFGSKTESKFSQGEIVETAAAAVVFTPADAIVRYSGQFRSYGQVLILDAGENYYIIMTGMGQINVELGQFLLQGEQVGAMPDMPAADKSEAGAGDNRPKLYIEIRKDSRPVNPALWWASNG